MTARMRARGLLPLALLGVTLICMADTQTVTRVLMTTSMGDIELELYLDKAPLTAGNFLRLIDAAHLDDGSFYRAVSPENDNGSPPIAVIQGGIGDAQAPYPPITHESTNMTGLHHVDGSISMARAAIGTATTEFFICIGDQPALDFGAARNSDGQGFAVFGRVLRGMEVVRAIHSAPADAATDVEYVRGQILEQPVAIERVRRIP
jgi:peptidyl-prolyl cis-trans isomerase A (cyclophilin A)